MRGGRGGGVASRCAGKKQYCFGSQKIRTICIIMSSDSSSISDNSITGHHETWEMHEEFERKKEVFIYLYIKLKLVAM